MATVTSQLTRIHDAEGALTTANLPAGGAGAAANTDIFLQGSQSLGKRIIVTATTEGFVLIDAADNDCSAADVHVGIWFWVTHYGILDDVRLILATGTGSPTNYDSHNFPFATEYPKLGGWVRAWVDVSRAPDTTGGTGLAENQLRSYGVQVSFSAAPGGNAANLILDAADFTNGGAALQLTGTGGVWTDFTTDDENTTNQYGVFRKIGGKYSCFARVQLGTASSLVFSDSGDVVFPHQALVADTFMGVTCDLQHASTAITLTYGSFSSSGTKRGDFVVTGTSGTLTVTGRTFDAMRIVTLNSKCTLLNCPFTNTGQITAAGASLVGCNFSGYEGTANTSLLVWDVNTDPDTKLEDAAFTKGTAATHAIEFGTTSPTTMTLTGVAFSGYNAANGNNDSTLHVKRTTGTVTINLVGCTGNISYRSDGATVVLVIDPVALTVTCQDGTTKAALQNVRVLVLADTGGDLPADETVTITRSGSTATVAHTGHGMATGDLVRIKKANEVEYNGVFTITVTGVDAYTYTVSGTPATPATGTIKASACLINALTDVNGQVTDTRSYTANQPITGNAYRGGSTTPYKTAPISGTVNSAAGASVTVPMTADYG